MVQKLVRECCELEALSFSNCLGLKCLCISEAQKLKNLTIRTESRELQCIKIVVPSLQQLVLNFTKYWGFVQFATDWGGPSVVDVAACPHLVKLTLTAFFFKDQEFHELISKFPLLEDLNLCGNYFLERFKISSEQLKHLSVTYCCYLKAMDVDAPNLLSFVFQHNLFPITSMNAQCTWKNLQLECYDDLDGCWFLNLKEFFGLSNQIDDLTLDLRVSQSLFNLYKISKCSNYLPVQVGSLMFWMELTDVLPSEYEMVLDGLFWLFHPRTLCLSTMEEEMHPFIVWLFDYLINPDTKCCNSNVNKSWRHYLKDAKIQSFRHFEGRMVIGDELNQFMDKCSKFPEGFSQFHLDWWL